MFNLLKSLVKTFGRKVKIQRLIEEEWIDFKVIKGKGKKAAWDSAVTEVISLNSEEEGKYRAIYVDGPLTYIYCSGFYIVPTVRFY
jgi:hypothetical protein